MGRHAKLVPLVPSMVLDSTDSGKLERFRESGIIGAPLRLRPLLASFMQQCPPLAW